MLRFTPIETIPLGPLHISTHGLFMALGIVVAFLLIRREVKHKKLSLEILENATTWMILGGIIGARVLYILLHLKDYANIIDVFKIWEGGLVSFGGIIGGFLAFVFYCRKKKIDWLEYADIIAPYMLLGWGIGRIGDFVSWGEFGTETSLPWGIDVGFGTVRHPAQLYELVLLVGGFISIQLYKKRKQFTKGYLFSLSMIYFFGQRFFIEFVRDYPADNSLIPYRVFAQVVSSALALFFFLYFLYMKRKR